MLRTAVDGSTMSTDAVRGESSRGAERGTDSRVAKESAEQVRRGGVLDRNTSQASTIEARLAVPSDLDESQLSDEPRPIQDRCELLVPGEQAPLAGSGMHALDRVLQIAAWLYLSVLVAAIVGYKTAFVGELAVDPLFTAYGLAVTAYILSRFLVALFYRPTPDVGYEPTVAVVMPTYNEREAISRSVTAILTLDYPSEKLEVVVVDDGSTDGTWDELTRIRERAGARVSIVRFPANRGKREAMTAGILATSATIVTFVDSDSVLDSAAMREIVQPFANPEIGAVCGHADVLQPWQSWLTRMQAVRYFVAFRVIKAAESVFGIVTCCSGCFAAYRRDAIMPTLQSWREQKFLGVQCTYGDDRALTNRVLRHWKVVYQSTACSRTIVPHTMAVFMKQQLRWKRSWTRESIVAATFIWRKNPLGSLPIYAGIVLPLIAPITVFRSVYWGPVHGHAGLPLVYLAGIYSMAVVYGLYYETRRGQGDRLWVWGVMFVFYYLVALVWQTYYAILTSRSTSWGTRVTAEAQDHDKSVSWDSDEFSELTYDHA